MNKSVPQLTHNEYITKLEITEDTLTLHIGYSTKLTFKLIGDCCSKSFFTPESIEDAKKLEYKRFYGYEVRKQVLADKTETDAEGWETSIEYNALVISTPDGQTTLDWRNSSNGYYSGDILVSIEEDLDAF